MNALVGGGSDEPMARQNAKLKRYRRAADAQVPADVRRAGRRAVPR
jgi:hypothetical protein